ncbi:hypothetical protein [Mycolicibacterium sp. XJ1819]
MTNKTISTAKSAAAEMEPSEPRAADRVEPELAESAHPPIEDAIDDTPSPRGRRSIHIGIRGLVFGAVIVLMAGAVAVMAWLYIGAQRQLDAQALEAADSARAEKTALDYAVKAATMDFNDLDSWKVALVEGTSPELNGKLSDAAESMEQIVVPLQWTSTAEPLVAKVRSNTDGTFVVDCFVSVQTKTVQAPDALQSTATYSITIDSGNNWQITDVGGVGSVVGPR